MKFGDMAGFTQALYSRSFHPRSDGDAEMAFGKSHKLVSEALGLPDGILDEQTRFAVSMTRKVG